MTKPLLILGGGGHASVLVDVLRQQGRGILGLVSPEPLSDVKIFDGIPHIYSDNEVLVFNKNDVMLVNGVGSLPNNHLRAKLYQQFSELGYKFETIVSNQAVVSDYADLGEGVQIMSGAIVQAGTFIGANSIINTGAIVDHDCNLGANNHVAPGAVLSGQVTSKEYVHFGTGCSVIQSINIGKRVVVGAGATITRNLSDNTMCLPAVNRTKVVK